MFFFYVFNVDLVFVKISYDLFVQCFVYFKILRNYIIMINTHYEIVFQTHIFCLFELKNTFRVMYVIFSAILYLVINKNINLYFC